MHWKEKWNAKIERDSLFDTYLDAIDKLAKWEAGYEGRVDNGTFSQRKERRKELIDLFRNHVASVSKKLRDLDTIITTPTTISDIHEQN